MKQPNARTSWSTFIWLCQWKFYYIFCGFCYKWFTKFVVIIVVSIVAESGPKILENNFEISGEPKGQPQTLWRPSGGHTHFLAEKKSKNQNRKISIIPQIIAPGASCKIPSKFTKKRMSFLWLCMGA